MLELVRIFVLLVLFESVILWFGGLQPSEEIRQILSLIGLVLFAIWYRKRGQFTGWFKVSEIS